MRKILWLLLVAVFVLPTGDAFARKSHHPRDSVDPVFGVRHKHHRPHVVIHKRPAVVCNTPGCDGQGQEWTRRQKVEAVGVLAFLAPPLLIAYDLQRRTNCQGDVLGLGGPGFSSPITPATGNVMTTAYMRGECTNTPTPRYRRSR